MKLHINQSNKKINTIKLEEFDKYVLEQSERFRTNNIILTMGGDFTYMAAHTYYKNLDLLIRYAAFKE